MIALWQLLQGQVILPQPKYATTYFWLVSIRRWSSTIPIPGQLSIACNLKVRQVELL